MGKGLCRGENWQDGKVWPKNEGKETFDECLQSCTKDLACTAFDVAPIENSLKFQCTLFGHEDIKPANSVSLKGRCIKMIGRKALPISQHSVDASGEGYISLGQGLCRGENWQSEDWPKYEGLVSKKDCLKACKKTRGCTSYDFRDAEGKKVQCYLFGHQDIQPASGLKGECFKLLSPKAGDSNLALLIGKGACRGDGWQDGGWPILKGKLTLDQCGNACLKHGECTAFDVKPIGQKMDCILYGHSNVVPASGVPGNCYSPPTTLRAVKKAPTSGKKKKKEYKIPEFDEPTVLEDDDGDDDDVWLFEPPPPVVRSRAHIDEVLNFEGEKTEGKAVDDTLKELKKIYENSVKPLEDIYKYKELSNRHFGDPEIFSKPLVVLMGPWSGGKSTMINYLLGTEFTKNAFRAGTKGHKINDVKKFLISVFLAAEPSPGFNFNIAMHGDTEEELDGTQLAAEWTFSSLQKFGQEFLKKLQGKKFPNKLLTKVQSKPWKMFAATLLPSWPSRPKTNVTLLFYFLKLYNFVLSKIFVGSTSSELQHPWISKITTEPKKSQKNRFSGSI